MSNEESAVPQDLRTEPVQRRSIERIDLLLDTAAGIIDEHGINGLTTSDVAARSGSSVGVVYRYYPNIDSLLLALAGRNLVRYQARLEERIREDGLEDWQALVRLAVLAYADLARSEPGFRTIRFGDLIVFRFPELESDTNGQFARQFGAMFVDRFGFRGGREFELALEVCIEVADALTRRAFIHDRNGEERFIAKTIELETDLLAPFAPGQEAPS